MYALNALSWILKSDVKIFLIGFNKTGTTTLHHFFRRNGLRSAHFRANGRLIAAEMSRNVSRDTNILKGIEGFTVYSDLCLQTADVWLEANTYFPVMFRQYPRSYFILSDRNVERWIASRLHHGNLAQRAHAYYGTEDDVKIGDIWRKAYAEHKEAAEVFFRDKPRFLVFDIENHEPSRIASFLAPDFRINAAKFAWKNKSVPVAG
jgi:hypothetical protein